MTADLSKYSEADYDEVFPTGKIFRIVFDHVTGDFRIFSTSQDNIDQIVKTFACPNKAAFYSGMYGYQQEDKVYIVNKFGYFPIGFLFNVLEYIKTVYGSLSCVAISKSCMQFIKDYLTPLSEVSKFELSNVSDDTGRNVQLANAGKQPYAYRDYQKAMIEALLFSGKGRGLIESPTGSGKSFIIANLIWNLHKHVSSGYKYLIFVPNKQLVTQFYSDLLDYGFDKSMLTMFTAGLKKDQAYDPCKPVIIANRQYVFSNLDKLPKIDVLIADEVHTVSNVKSNTFQFIRGLNCAIKFGCSGTLPRDKYQKWSLIGLFGKVMYTEDITHLQDSGYLSKLKISVIKVNDSVVENDRNYLFNEHPFRHYNPDDPSDVIFNEAYNDEINYINEHFQDLYSPVLKEIEKLDDNILILFDRIDLGTNMFKLAQEIKLRGSSLHYIDGNIDVNVREDIRKSFEASGDNILFAQQSTFATGINIRRLKHIVFFFSTKEYTKIIQAIGRTLRLHAEKDSAHLVDVTFNFKYSQRHFKERMKIYRESYKKRKPDEVIELHI